MSLVARLIIIDTFIVAITDAVVFWHLVEHPHPITIPFVILVIIVTVIPIAINLWYWLVVRKMR
jgi:hypothetical protein